MKILYFKAKNFATILTAMKRREITIDLRKSKNRVVLLVGENGTGKTAIMSQLHPFSTPGNMDVRNGGDQIIKDKDGYKEIHFQNHDDIYEIKHHYLQKTTKGTKSYISKNGVEMNPNGNVTSFREIVETELSLTQDYMKLLRLGPNVTNFIRMKATERKNFTSDLLSDIDVYSKFYKKINDDSRLLKSLMKSVSDKIDKLKVYDEVQELQYIEDLNERLSVTSSIRDRLTGDIGKIEGSIDTLVPDGESIFKSELRFKRSELTQLSNDIRSSQNKNSKMDVIIIGDIDSTIESTKNKITDSENKITISKSLLDFYFNQLSSLHDLKKEKEDGMKYISSELEYSKISDLFLQLNLERDSLGEKFKGFAPKCTRSELLTALAVLQEMESFANDIYEFAGAKETVSVVDMFINGQDVDSFVRREVSKLDDEIHALKSTSSARQSAENINKDSAYILFQPPNCECDCPFKKFYNDATGVVDEVDKKDSATEIRRKESKRENLLSFIDIARKLDYIMLLIKSNQKLAEKMPEDFFNAKHILTSIKNFIPFYDENYITNYISLIEDYDRYVELGVKIKEVGMEKHFIEKNGDSIVSVQNELAMLDIDIYRITKDIDDMKESNKSLIESVSEYEDMIETYIEYKTNLTKLNEKIKEAEKLQDEINSMNSVIEKVDMYLSDKHEYLKRLSIVDKELSIINSDITNTNYRLLEFKSLTKEKKQLETSFDDIDVIKEALSSNKGIPLLFIQLYLKNTRMMVNQLLDTVYNGELEIEDFVINDKEFAIPYVKNGLIIDDVVNCSQGEESFVSMALSFALISQSIKDYNIMLLDEIDATLDTKKRVQFLSILEEQLDSIDAEQVFLITHNNMFDNYPVDIIMTSETVIDNYKNMNILFNAGAK